MQIDRLFKIIYILLDRKTITARELSEKLEVSIRTIYRDIDTLSLNGIPIYTTKGKGGGIGILDSFILNKSLLSESDQNEILIGLQSLKVTKHLEADSLSSKLSSLFKKNNFNLIEVDLSSWGSSDNGERFNLLKEAILGCKVVGFGYYSSYGVKTNRRVEPLKLCFKDKSWYLHGYCTLKNDYRLFKISRMANISITDETFTVRSDEGFSVVDLEESQCEMVNLKLLFSSQVAYRVYDEFPHESIVKNEDGSLSVIASYPKGAWIYGFILSFGSFVKVIEPKHIRETIKNELVKTMKNYDI